MSPRSVTRTFLLCVVIGLAPGCSGSSSHSAGPTPTHTVASPVATRSRSSDTSGAYAQAVLGDHPVAYYRLGDAAGAKMCDASTSANDGTYATHGLTYQQPGFFTGGGGAALASDGSVNPGTSGTTSPVVGATDFSLEGWFKTTSQQDEIVVDIGQPGAGRLAGIGPSSSAPTNKLCGGLDNAIGFDTYDGYVTADAGRVGIKVFDGRWHHVVGTYAGTRGGAVAIYLDGKLLRSTTIRDAPAASPVRVGYWVDSVCNSPFAGSLEDVAVYHAVLTAQQVKTHFTVGHV